MRKQLKYEYGEKFMLEWRDQLEKRLGSKSYKVFTPITFRLTENHNTVLRESGFMIFYYMESLRYSPMGGK